MEVAGLAIGALGVTGLFTACIENFDIVVRARDFGRDFDLLCTQLSVQRIRLFVWGENLGLVAGPDGTKLPFNHLLDRDDIQPTVESTLDHLRLLLQDADVVTGRYALSDGRTTSENNHLMLSRGMAVLRDRFDSFKERLRTSQKQTSVWKVTQWAVHDLARFRGIIDDVERLLDGLDSITTSLNLLSRQYAMMAREIESVSDAESLLFIQEATSRESQSISLRLVSDAASTRLTMVTGSGRALESNTSSSWQSFYTAPSGGGLVGSSIEVPSGIPQDQTDHQKNPTMPLTWATRRISDRLNRVKPTTAGRSRDPPSDRDMGPQPDTSEPMGGKIHQSQNQRVMSELLAKFHEPHPTLDFNTDGSEYGKALKDIKAEDTEIWNVIASPVLLHADAGHSLARRMFMELRSIRHGVPFISAAPLDDRLDVILASIKGPPGTPYENGIFWVAVQYNPGAPEEAPLLRFHTRVYHPNIDCEGRVCADYKDWWRNERLQYFLGSAREGGRDSWFITDHTLPRFSLGALLTAICGLLGSPNVEDPLVPEIAEMYVKNYPEYQRLARLYTQQFATGERPRSDLVQSPMAASDKSWSVRSAPARRPTSEAGVTRESSEVGSILIKRYAIEKPARQMGLFSPKATQPGVDEQKTTTTFRHMVRQMINPAFGNNSRKLAAERHNRKYPPPSLENAIQRSLKLQNLGRDEH